MKNLLIILCCFAALSCSTDTKEQKGKARPKAEKAKIFPTKIEKENRLKAVRLENCSKSFFAAEDAYKHAKKAQHSENFEDIRNHAKDAMNAFEDAQKYANKCGCKKANSVAEDGYKIAKKAYKADNIQQAQGYASEARKIADALQTYSDNCSYN